MDFLAYTLVSPLLRVISMLPFRVIYFISDAVLYPFLYHVVSYRKRVVRKNLALVFPEKSQLERLTIEKKFYHHFCDTCLEAIKPISMTSETMKKRLLVKNPEVFGQYSDRSMILTSGHYANWEWLGILGKYTEAHGFYGIYSKLQNRYFDKFIRGVRERFGTILIEKRETPIVIRSLDQSGKASIYGFITDQSPQVGSSVKYWRPFLGKPVPVYTNFESIAIKYNYVVFFVEVQKVKRGYYACELKLITDNPKACAKFEITDAYTDMLETQIKEKPEYYLWTHKRWKHRHLAPETSLLKSS